jgi:hypothetical protein
MDVIVISKKELDSFKYEIIQELTSLINEKESGERKPWLRTRDVCKLLNISTSTLQHLRDSGIIPFKKLEGLLLYDSKELDKVIREWKPEK